MQKPYFLNMTLDLKIFPDPVLSSKCAKVTEFTKERLLRIQQMQDTLYAIPGLALAAPQVGILERIIVLNMRKIQGGEEMLALINPVINSSEGEVRHQEGCLSIPEIFEEVARHEKIVVEGIDLNGNNIFFDADDILARTIQHEIDHLDGILFWDRLPEKKRKKLKEKFFKSY